MHPPFEQVSCDQVRFTGASRMLARALLWFYEYLLYNNLLNCLWMFYTPFCTYISLFKNTSSHGGHYAKWSQPVTKGQVMYHPLHEILVFRITETESRIVGGRAGRRRVVSCLMVAVWEDEKVLEKAGGGGCTTVQMNLMSWTVYPTRLSMIRLILHAFYHKELRVPPL